jgi:hypothetical protein
VVFSGSGYYSFSEVDAYVEDACLTLVGQSAPSPGVTIRDGGIHTVASNVVYQHIRIRPGDGGALLYTSSDHNGILIGYGPGITENVLLDHVSVSWAGGKNVQIVQDIPETAGPYGVVLWRSATTEALWRADNVHADGDGDGPIQPEDWASLPSSFGWHIDVHGDAQVSIMENLAAHNGARNPSWGEGNLYFLSNVVYDFGYDCMPGVPHCNHYPWAALKYGGSAAGSRFEAVGNKFISSPQAAVAGVELLYGIGIWTNEGGDADRAHELDNAVDDSAGPPIQLTVEHEGITGWFEDTDVLDMTGIVTTPSSSVEAFVLSNVGARPLDRDAVDVRVIDQVTQRTGAMIRDPDDDTPGYPPLANDTHVLDIPTDPNGPGACGASRSRIECWALDHARALEPAAN